MNIQLVDIFRPFLGKLTWRRSSSSKVIYLTFDDGPVPEVTPLVLNLLDKYNVKATFFCVGENVRNNPELYNEILRRGHRTGNHTFNHVKGFNVPTSEYVANVDKAAEFIDSKLFRPPYGRIKRNQIRNLKSRYEIIMWDLLTFDYNQKIEKETIIKRVKRQSRNGSIVVFHDSLKAKNNMLSVLPLAIEFWNSKGYTFELL